MRILLISLFNEWSLGLRSLAATLKQHGHQVTVAHLHTYQAMMVKTGLAGREGLDTRLDALSQADLDALGNLVSEKAPELIGVSVTGMVTAIAKQVTRELKRSQPAPPIIWGGIGATLNPESALEVADIVCIGEGEEAMVELAEKIAGNQDYSRIPNLWVRKGDEIHRNDVRPLLQDLDSLPWPDYSVRDHYYIQDGPARNDGFPENSELHKAYPLLSGRGCPYSCTFCANSTLRQLYGARNYVRYRSVENVVGEIVHHRKRHPGVETVVFDDDVFGGNTPWMKRFTDLYPRRVGLSFACSVHPLSINAERIDLLRRSGLTFVSMGIQSGSQRVLRDIYQRNTPRERILEAARLIQGAGVTLAVEIIGHNPLENEEDYQQTLDLLLDLPEGYMLRFVYPLAIFRNYPIAKMLEESDGIIPFDESRDFSYAKPQPDFTFWKSLFLLAQFPSTRGIVKSLAQDPYLREHPEDLEALAQALLDATYLPVFATRYPDALRRTESELGALKGSRAIRLCLRLKQWLRRK